MIEKVSTFRDKMFVLLCPNRVSRYGRLYFLFYCSDLFLLSVNLTICSIQALLAARIKHSSLSLSPLIDAKFVYYKVLLLKLVFQQLLRIYIFPKLILSLQVEFSQGLRKLRVLPKVLGISN